MRNYKVVYSNFETEEFDNFKKASDVCVKKKGMLYVNRDGFWVKHSNWDELKLGVKEPQYNYVERAEAKLYRCKRCNRITIMVNMYHGNCKMCNGSLTKIGG